MGQYYMPTLIDSANKMKTFYSHEYDNGLKLLEHAYMGNSFVAAVLYELAKAPHRLWWLGDYAQIEDFKNSEHKLYSRERKRAWKSKNCRVTRNWDFPHTRWDYDDYYIINTDKLEYIRFPKLYNNCEGTICPLCLLTAVGNGRGCGDYYSNNVNYDLVGIWAGDKIYVTPTLDLQQQETMTDKTSEYFFKESF